MTLLGYLKNLANGQTEEEIAYAAEYAAWKEKQRQASLPAPPVDRSNHPNVVQYAVITLMKGKTPASAAKSTAKKLSGGDNMFLGPGISLIDAATLENAIYEYMVQHSLTAGQKPGGKYGMLNNHPAPYSRALVERYTQSTLAYFGQERETKAQLAVETELLKRTLAKLGDAVES